MTPVEPAATVLLRESFDAPDLARWQEVEVNGRTAYAIQAEGGERYLAVSSRAGASILLRFVRFDPARYERLSWRWRIDQFTGREDLRSKRGSDAAARLYVYFNSKGLPWQKRNLDYVWSEHLPVDTLLTSAFSSSSKIIVAQSGVSSAGQWQQVTRNLEDDYRRAFGQEAPDVVAIGVMTDTDSTGAQAAAAFDEVVISR